MSVAIIIVNWNTGELLANCVRSLLALPQNERALINSVWIVDNASHDDSVLKARAAAGENRALPITFIENTVNAGFPRANNQVIEKVRGKNGHILLLNPDTEIRPGALTNMLAVFAERSDVGIVGPKLVNPDGSLQGSVRPFPELADFVLYMLKLGRVIQSHQEGQHNYGKAGYVDQVMGAAFLIKNDVIRDIGLLDDDFFILFEEVDYAKRAKSAGWRSFYTPAATIMHVKAASFNQVVGFRRSWPWLKSSLRYAGKHLPAWQVVILYALVPVSLLLVLPASFKHLLLKYAH